jgi:hypothetical protein
MKTTLSLIASLVLGAIAASATPTVSAQAPGPDKLVDALEGTFGKHVARR